MRAWIAKHSEGSTHQGFPVVDEEDCIVGVLTRRDLLDPNARAATGQVRDLIKRPPAVIYEDSSLREASNHMVREGIGRLPVVARDRPSQVIGIVTRSDLMAAYAPRLDAERRGEPRYRWNGRPTAGQRTQAKSISTPS